VQRKEVKTKMKLMFKHMEERPQEISSKGTYTCTVGTFTPRTRFTKDEIVPSCTRYSIPSDVVKLSFKPSKEEEQVYAEAQNRMKLHQMHSQMTVVSDNTDVV
jgi:hypothetical protein